MADPIAALKALVDISKLKSGEDAAAEYLSKVRNCNRGDIDVGDGYYVTNIEIWSPA